MHCESCGAAIEADAAHARYCIQCGLYVCFECWRPEQDRCRVCARQPSESGGPLWTARRADRRLREVARDAAALAGPADDTAGDETHFAHDTLAIKASTAEEVGRRALERLPPEDAATVRPLAERLEEHAHEATDAIERGDATPTANDRTARLQPWPVAIAAIAVVIAVAVMALQPRDDPTVGSAPTDTIAGGGGGDATAPAAGDTEPPGASPGPVGSDEAEPEPVVITLDFDEMRMGAGIGDEWRRTEGSPEAVAVAAVPNAVDRSAELEVVDDREVEACTAVEPPLGALERLTVDVRFSTATATAAVRLRPSPGQAGIEIRLANSAIAALDGATAVAESEGLDPDAWYRAEIAIAGEETFITVTALSDGEELIYQAPLGVAAPLVAGEVCIGLTGEAGDAGNFDDLTITGS